MCRLAFENPDFIEQRDHGANWLEQVSTLLSPHALSSGELNGLTGCCEALLPKEANAASLFNRLATLFKR